MQTPKVKVRFTSTLPHDERMFLLAQSKNFRDRYYAQVFNTKKRGQTPLTPKEYYDKHKPAPEMNIQGLKSFNEIADALELPLVEVKLVYNEAMQKIRSYLGV